MNLAHRQGAIRSLDSFQGNMLTSAFGASIAHSMATAYVVGGDVVRQDQDRVLATTHEIACHGEDEVGVRFEHLGHKLVGRLHRDLGPLAVSKGPQLFQNVPGYLGLRISDASPRAASPAPLRQYDWVRASGDSR